MLIFLKRVLIFSILTIFTQVGGLIYIFYQFVKKIIEKKRSHKLQLFGRIGLFSIFYLLATLLFIPPIAKQLGRVPLPYYVTQKSAIKPLTIFTNLLNRHYVKPQLLATIKDTAHDLEKEYPNTQIVYLDANFPFWNGFPLLPHLSHNDGKKLDLAFIYKDAHTQELLYSSPSYSGYGIYESPRKGELNQPNICQKKGYWQYGILTKITPQWNKNKIIVDEVRTKKLLQLLAKHQAIGKIFIEPHLKTRWKLEEFSNIRYHGCHAVRHDDHIHIQL